MSSIRGGGRAIMSSEAEEMIISLLYDTRQSKNPLLPKKIGPDDDCDGADDENDQTNDKKKEKKDKKDKGCFAELSDHDKKKERKKFLKKLVKCHDRQTLRMRLNGSKNKKIIEEGDEKPAATAGFNRNIRNESVNLKPKSDKVRIDIVEAIFKDSSSSSGSGSKKSKKSSSSSSKSKASKWKEGSTRKTIVLSRSTSVKDFMTQCKSKLKMKKPTRVFYVDRESKLEIDLTNDLSGLDDGAIVFATSFLEKKASKSSDTTKEPKESELDEDIVPLVDPLESVKKAYNIQKRKRGKTSRMPIYEKLLPFTDALDNLETLSEARSKLPAANYRSDILASLDTSRVVVICGATGKK